MNDAKSRIHQLSSEFVAQLQQIAREEVVRILDGSDVANGHAAPKSRTDRPKKSEGGKRSKAALEDLKEQALATIRANAGLRIEEINAQLRLGAGELALPIRKLLAERAIKTTGQRRATRYFAAAGRKSAKGKRRGKR